LKQFKDIQTVDGGHALLKTGSVVLDRSHLVFTVTIPVVLVTGIQSVWIHINELVWLETPISLQMFSAKVKLCVHFNSYVIFLRKSYGKYA